MMSAALMHDALKSADMIDERDLPKHRPTPEMIADAHRRNAAPRPIVSWLMGDPAPGQSALDKRNSAV
ncbi:hypothetical protein [Bradyrhizobium erythrophlei]|uniref:Uncharacterized protein n=1 Tax=Bradyrhizobium erythrophlei TaxID=1437360 RepID=A0A1M5NKY0_9BRAD|nr:hypothetical protein [Bradyrhizobium erythrophlei]SHG90162.1 hypothetical protein SAMN05443248_3034 [Bradyrhizobium erythrophlei]